MGILTYFSIYFISLANLRRKPDFYLNALIFCLFFLKFIVLKIDPNWAGASSVFVYLMVITLFLLIMTSRYKRFKNDEHILLVNIIKTLSLIFLYFTLSAILRSIPPMTYLGFIKHYFYYIIVFFFILSFPKKLNHSLIKKFIFRIFVLEVFLGFFQFIGPNFFADFFKVISYQWNNGTTYLLSPAFWDKKLVLGTLLRLATYGNTIGFLLVFFVGKALLTKEKNNSNKFMVLITVLTIFVVFATGIRTSAFSLIVGLLIVLFFYNKQYLFILLLSVSLFVFIYYQILISIGSYAIAGKTSIENPFERIIGLINVFSNLQAIDFDNALVLSLTLGRSIVLFDYFLSDPFFGSGVFWKQGYYGMLYAGSSSASWSDSALMFHLVEFGIIGLGLILVPFVLVLSYAKRKLRVSDFKVHFSVFIVLIMQSITDQSLFSPMGSILFITLIALDLVKAKHKRKII